jgi:hypothetical protein
MISLYVHCLLKCSYDIIHFQFTIKTKQQTETYNFSTVSLIISNGFLWSNQAVASRIPIIDERAGVSKKEKSEPIQFPTINNDSCSP